jgi:2-haloacid dehalogenase
MRRLREARIRVVTLTNGSEPVTRKPLAKAEVGDLVERVVSVDEVRHWKPHPEVYHHCARSAGVDPAALALVAAYGWDIHGAGHAGLITAYVARSGEPFPATMRAPDVTGSSLAEAVDRLLEGTPPAEPRTRCM